MADMASDIAAAVFGARFAVGNIVLQLEVHIAAGIVTQPEGHTVVGIAVLPEVYIAVARRAVDIVVPVQ